ncbi:hypothetical protein ACFSY7_03690 [Kurthia populi]|uniref:Uncharacterized protein n=1 Tax=Kurthia populi TaxID=1562132 RepID=A0ABW5XX83_9BACL
MNQMAIEKCTDKIQKVLNYTCVTYVKQTETCLYFSAIDQQMKHHTIWYNLENGNYFETLNGSVNVIKEILFFDTKEALTQYKQK